LNVQLSRYQERLRSNAPTLTVEGNVFKPNEKYDGFESILTASLSQRHESNEEDGHTYRISEDGSHAERVVDLSGLLSAQALAPLFDAYQENLQEKDNLILDYEKQFENMNKKSKQIVEENKALNEKVSVLEEELVGVRQRYKKIVVEKETNDIERATLLERAERAEFKLKEVYELYEGKMAAMLRDYETVHREYFTVKSALEASTGKMAALDALRVSTVPADLHERRLDDCKRLLEELKHQYSMDTERKNEQIKKLEEELHKTDEKYKKICEENVIVKEELRAALKNVRLYRKAAVVFRHRARSAAARATRARRKKTQNEPLRKALEALERIKMEIKIVKSRAHTSLEELERRIVEQERRAAHAQAECRRELERASLALEHKEGIIRSLIDKVADVEEVRLSQTNTHRLQGIVSDSSDSSPKNLDKKERSNVKFVPGPASGVVATSMYRGAALILLLLGYCQAQDLGCDFVQNVFVGRTYYIYSPNYPNSYNRGITCRWIATCPVGYNCRLNCIDINLPQTSSCSGDRLLISRSGDPQLTSAETYCGRGTLNTVSTGRTISVGLITTQFSTGGRFMCELTAVLQSPPSSCSCGYQSVNRIVGGEPTRPHEFPMMAGIVYEEESAIKCGGVIISANYVVTAAHCVVSKNRNELAVVVGAHDTSAGADASATQAFRVASFLVHPQYTPSNYDYDIAIVRLAGQIRFSALVGPVCLPFRFRNDDFTGSPVTIIGWGTLMPGGPTSPVLRKVDVNVISQETCRNIMGSITPRQMCTYARGKDSCQDDSGGPLLYRDLSNGLLYYAGIVSYGTFCASTTPSVNTRVTALLDWIVANAPDDYCIK
ncbi:unnamed protein product, partial [Brenthis ino]